MNTRTALLQTYCLSLLQGARAWRRLADEEVKAFGLSEATAYPLVFMTRLGDGIRQSALADAIGIEGPSLVRLLDQLCAAGLIERREDASDRRAKTLHFTTYGRDVTASLSEALDRRRSRTFAHVSTSDLEAAIRVLSVLDEAPSEDRAPSLGRAIA